MKVSLLLASTAFTVLIALVIQSATADDLQVRYRRLNLRSNPDPNALGKQVKQVNDAIVQLNDIVSKVNTTATVISSLAKFANSAGPVIGILGAVFSIVAAFLPKGEDPILKELREQFGKTFDRLDDLDRKLDYVMGHVEKMAAYSDYKTHRNGFLTIEGRYKDFLRSPGLVTEEDFINACKSRSPTDMIKWIHQRVTKPLIEPHLLPTILTGTKYNMKELKQWAALVVSDVTQLALHQASCLGIRNASQSTIDLKASDTKRFLIEITDSFTEYETKLKNEWKDKQLENDIRDKLNQYNGRSHADFAVGLKNLLDHKYDWMYFGVSAYDAITGYEVHTIACYTCKWIWRTKGRNTVVYWAELKWMNGYSKPMRAKAATALQSLTNSNQKVPGNKKAEDVVNYLKTYLPQKGVAAWQGWTSILVVNDGHAMSSSFHNECTVSHRLRFHHMVRSWNRRKRSIEKRRYRPPIPPLRKKDIYYNVIVAT